MYVYFMFRSDQLPSEMLTKMTNNIAKVQDYKTKQVSFNKVCYTICYMLGMIRYDMLPMGAMAKKNQPPQKIT